MLNITNSSSPGKVKWEGLVIATSDKPSALEGTALEGLHRVDRKKVTIWIPAFAGMTKPQQAEGI